MAAHAAIPLGPGDLVLANGVEVGFVVAAGDGAIEVELDPDVATRMVEAGIPQANIQMVLNAIR